jgi:hypothetical protein
MDVTIHFQSSIPRRKVVLHAWEPQGETWNLAGAQEGTSSFAFRVKGGAADQRTVRFKLRFPDERRWERDEYVRSIPSRHAEALWIFDDSPRVMTRDPFSRPAPAAVTVQLVTRARFVGGSLYAWQPGTDASARFPESSRDRATDASSFTVRLAPWMERGFHYKFVDRGGAFESDACNRVWRPADGAAISTKSGQVTSWAGAPVAKQVRIALLYPRTLDAAPDLLVVDRSGEAFERTISAARPPAPDAGDPRFERAEYALALYPEAPSTVQLRDPALEGRLPRPLCVEADDEGAALTKLTILGDARWLDEAPGRAPLSLVFHARPWTPELATLAFEVSVGNAPAFERVAAHDEGDGTWRAETSAPIGVVLQTVPVGDRPVDQRADGPVSTKRRFELAAATPVELHTVDAQPGLVTRPLGGGPSVGAPR